MNIKDDAQVASLTRNEILGALFYTGGLGYFAQLHAMNSMLSTQSDSRAQLFINSIA